MDDIDNCFKKNINLSIESNEKIEISIAITADATTYKLFFHKFLTLKCFLFFFFYFKSIFDRISYHTICNMSISLTQFIRG